MSRIKKILLPVLFFPLFGMPVIASAADCPAQPPVCPPGQTLFYVPDDGTCTNAQMKCHTLSRSSPAHSSSILSRGARGARVLSLQQSLIAAGLLSADSASGFFGAATEAAVKQFQTAHGLDVTGAIGPKTRSALANSATVGSTTGGSKTSDTAHQGATSAGQITRILGIGSKGSDVATLQSVLVTQSILAPDSATGFFGKLTESAVRQFQAAHGLEPVGSVGRMTRNLVNDMLATIANAIPNVTPPSSAQSSDNTTTSLVTTGGNGWSGFSGSGGKTPTPSSVSAGGNGSSVSNTTPTSNPVSGSTPIVTISATPATIMQGGSFTITWSSTNATSCTASGGWSGAQALSGSQIFSNLVATTTYTLSCTGAGGATTNAATVAVLAPVPAINPLYGSRIVALSPAVATSTILTPAIADLQKYLNQITGSTFALGQTATTGIKLILTASPLAPADAAAQLQGKGFEAFIIRGDATQLNIIANNERGLAYGIYYYLEQLGVRWLLPSAIWTIVPSTNNVTLTINKLVTPAFGLNRGYAGTGGFYSSLFGHAYAGSEVLAADTGNWDRSLRYSNEYHLGKAMGEAFISQNVSTLQAHPEYLAKIDGVYSPLYLGNGSLNIIAKLNAGNPAAVNYYCNWLISQYTAARNSLGATIATTMSAEPSDGGGEGNNTAELVAAGVGDGSPADQEFFIINQCARMLRAQYPDASVVSLAYGYHADPPTFPLESNVIIQPALAFRFGPKTANLSNDQWLALWSAKVGALGFYDYWSIPDWSHDEPSFNYVTVGNLLRTYYAEHIIGINAESTYSAGAMGIGHYVASHLMWDPTINDANLIDEWYTLAFGAAKAPMKRMMERWATTGYRPISAELGISYQDIQQAEWLAAGDSASQARVDDYARYLHYLRLRVELADAPDTTAAGLKATELAMHIFDIDSSHMVQTGRIFDLLARIYPSLNTQFQLPGGAGWTNVHPLTHTDIMNLIADGLSKYPPADFTIRNYTGSLVPLTPLVWSAPATTSPWGPMMQSGGALDMDLQMPTGLANFPLRVSQELNNTISISNDAGQIVYTNVVPQIATTTLIWDEMSIPLSPGHYKVHFYSSGGVKDAPFEFETWKGVPITLTSFLVPKPLAPQIYLYFYVPKGQQKVAIYLPQGYGQLLKVFDSHGHLVSTDIRDNTTVVVATVPSGEDGTVWSVNYMIAADVPAQMLTTPNTFSVEPQVLMVPSDALH